jgi:hypothetical protein
VILRIVRMDTVRSWLLAVAACGVVALPTFVGAGVTMGQNSRLTATASPDRTVLLAKEQDPDGVTRVFFVNAATEEKLGAVLSLFNEGDLANVNILSSWNPSSSKVALLIYYGVRSSKIKLFKKDDTGKFVPIDVTLPDPLLICATPDLKKLAEEHVSASENCLGPWTTDNSIRLVSGVMVDRGNNAFVHLLVTFTAVVSAKANIKDVKLFGPYSDQEADKFLEEWGTKYWEEPDMGGDEIDSKRLNPQKPGKPN